MLFRRNQTKIRTRAAFVSRRQWAIGFGVVLVALASYGLGLFHTLEYWFDDKRAEYFDFESPEPSADVVLIAIDDDSLDTIDLWPIPRRMLGEVVRELDRAGANVIAFDMIFDDPEGFTIEGDPDAPETWAVIDGDQVFADAIREHGNVVLATSFIWEDAVESSNTGIFSAPKVPFVDVFDTLASNPELEFDALRLGLAESGRYPAKLNQELTEFASGGAINDLRSKYDVSKTMLESAPRSSIFAPADGRDWPRSTTPTPPVPALAEAMNRLASVTFSSFDEDQRVRRIPLWVRQGGRLYPMLGLAAAAAHLDIPSSDIELRGSNVVLEEPGAERFHILEMHEAPLREQGRKYGLHYMTWPRAAVRPVPLDLGEWFDGDRRLFGRDRGWIGQFRSDVEEAELVNRERRREAGEGVEQIVGDERAIGTRMVAIGKILDPYLIKVRIRENLDAIDPSMNALYEMGLAQDFDLAAYNTRALTLRTLTFDDAGWHELMEEQRQIWENVAATLESFQVEFEHLTDLSPEEEQQKRICFEVPSSVRLLIRELDEGLETVRSFRNEILPRLVGGKICFIGWTATGAAADFISTSIDPKTPGVLVHMAVANSVLNDHALRFGPAWLDLVSIVGMGLLGTWIGVRFPVLVGPFALLGVMAVLLVLNGKVFWDQMDLKVALGMPFASASVSWIGVILDRLVVERAGRRRTEARFRSYVSPEVVDILVNNPNLSSMAPQKKELTIFFSDIASFTTLSEMLGTEGIKDLLGVYLGAMTEELQRHRATIDKYIGDAVMAFWGAPVDDPDHARHGALAALGQMKLLDEMNERGAFDPRAGKLVVRMGLATGEVNVGDFGNPPHKSAYTVIGDQVNLAARLESGCKQFGVHMMITEYMRSKMGDDIRTRPLGRIVVKGKSEPQLIHELVGDRTPHGAATGAWIETTESAVNAYIAGDFEKCLREFEDLKVHFGETRLASIYQSSIGHMRESGVSLDSFDGSIVLSEK
ncbi:MAG: CHASE2 domain-containing protein [Phycisphaerales bacterium]